MLVSHLHRFIYLKTVKTGGTSVEVYFERFCLDPSLPFHEVHARSQHVSRWGIIGCRQRSAEGQTWYNHMPAHEVRAHLGDSVWNSYFKFCVIRNPFDKVVSQFWYRIAPEQREALTAAPFDQVRTAFADFVANGPLPRDRQIFMIDGAPAVDFFVRHETLHSGLAEVCQRLGLPWDPDQVGQYKAGFRNRSEPFCEYYAEVARQRVADLYRWEIDTFGYSC